MEKTRNSAKPVSADALARLDDQGKDVSQFFKGNGRMAVSTLAPMVKSIRRVNVDVTDSMLEKLKRLRRTST